VELDQSKVKVVSDLSKPTSIEQLHGFLSLTSCRVLYR